MADLPIEDLTVLTVASGDDVLVIVDDPVGTPVTKQITKTNFLGGTNVTQVVGTTETQTLTNKTLTAPVISTITNTGTVTLPTATDTLVGRSTTDTLTNKTLTTPIIASILNTGLLTLPTSTDTLIGRDTTDTLTNKTLTSPTISTPTLSGAIAGTPSFTSAITPTGGLAAAGGFSCSPRLIHSGALPPATSTTGTDTTPVVTETYIVEVFIPANMTVTGVAVLNGSAVAGNMQISLADSTGAPIAAALTASTAASGTAAYQRVPFAVAYAALGPATYYILLQNNNTSNRFRSHVFGNFGASKKTGEVYGTFTTVTPPTTFTASLGPIASLY